jgi:hypothetical protein
MDASRPTERTERRALGSAYCPRCDGTTTHAGDACTGCLARVENRRIGALWLALGVPLLLVGLAAVRSVPSSWPPPHAHRSSLGLGLLLLLAGSFVAGRGLRGLLRGRSPD